LLLRHDRGFPRQPNIAGAYENAVTGHQGEERTHQLNRSLDTIQALRAFAAMAKDEGRRQSLAHASRRIALEHYSYDALSRRIEQAYRDVLATTTNNSASILKEDV